MNKESFVVVSEARIGEREKEIELWIIGLFTDITGAAAVALAESVVDRFVELRVGLLGLQNQRLRKGAVGRKDLRG